MTIGVSTLAFGNMGREEVVELARENKWSIEFSSSFPAQADMPEYFKKLNIPRFAHNYFPAPEDPFVLNLASKNSIIRKRSIEHCLLGFELSAACGAPYFSAHAGFCIDPLPQQLGKKLNVNSSINRKENWEVFIESLKFLLIEAEKLGVSFLVENNVTSFQNLREDNQDVLFCSRPEEMIHLINEINDENFGLLLDTAHLKVSAEALRFDPIRAVEEVKPFVKYLHHSDNDGRKDTNEPLDKSYWFLPFMKSFKECVHILEVKNQSVDQIREQLALLTEYDE